MAAHLDLPVRAWGMSCTIRALQHCYHEMLPCICLQKQKKQARNEKAAKQKQPATAAQEDTSWVGQHPWRPFDRERDLGIAPKPVGKEELLKSAGSLSGRFGGGGASEAQRSFL